MTTALLAVYAVVLIALIFEYINGFHDTANSIATVVGTKVLTPRQAIVLAAVTNLLGAFTGIAVAKTISSGLVDSHFVNQGVIMCALLGGIIWNLITWWFAMPSSSTHALVGGLTGAVLAMGVSMAAAGELKNKDGKPVTVWETLVWNETKEKTKKSLVDPEPAVLTVLAQEGEHASLNGTHKLKVGDKDVQVVVFEGRVKQVKETKKMEREGILNKVIIPMFTSPLVGFIGGFLIMSILYTLLRSARPAFVNRTFGKLQLGSAAYMGWSHGMNDATKTMGVITLALVTATSDHLGLPAWMEVSKVPDAYHLSPFATLVSWLPEWLQFGYMPDPVDFKAPGVPPWVVVICALTMAAGTAAGGWKIIKTMGHKMVKLQPVHGFAAETTAATLLAVTGTLGMPVSTTHAITTSIMGVGCSKRFSALKLGVVERIIWAWMLTIPAAGGIAFGLVWLCMKFGIIAPA
jgi:PiT family inorganic phosphate transporter